MKILITGLLLIGSVQAFANEKNVLCRIKVDDLVIKTVEADLNELNPRIDFGTINGLMLSLESDLNSTAVTIGMYDMQTMKVFKSAGSFGNNGEGLGLRVSNNGKKTDIACALRE